MPSRRAVLAGLAACVLPTPAFASARRIAAIDWGAFETALALGLTPVAATEPQECTFGSTSAAIFDGACRRMSRSRSSM